MGAKKYLRQSWQSTTRRAVSVLILVMIMVTLVTNQAKAQSTTSLLQIDVGSTSSPPIVDGQWQQGEWVNTIEYGLMFGSPQVTPRPTLRLVHDSTTLYGIIDVPSDNGTTSHPISASNPGTTFGGVIIDLWTKTDEIGWRFETNRTLHPYLYTGSVLSLTLPANVRATISSHTFIATGILGTVHSAAAHRVWEFSLPLSPYAIKGSLDDYNSTIQLGVFLKDSAGNLMQLTSAGLFDSKSYARMSFVGTPVPESVSVYVVLPAVMLLSLIVFVIRCHRKLTYH